MKFHRRSSNTALLAHSATKQTRLVSPPSGKIIPSHARRGAAPVEMKITEVIWRKRQIGLRRNYSLINGLCVPAATAAAAAAVAAAFLQR